MGYQQESSPEEEHYYLCYTYASCMSDGAEYAKVLECSNLAEPQDQTSLLNYIKKGNYYSFENTNWEDIIGEYCEIDPAKRSEVFDKSLKGAINFYMDKCTKPNRTTGMCTLGKCHGLHCPLFGSIRC
ncbi:hypothetical protein CEXT_353291 [Caerostris extrusa]|uniref:Uncharacterized protein n=1 Tax=Caerostris extrusa TaxID=172846 RepID=A0AAV4XC24_CAEEX|nr:hypothetical protein CEXT_353291 [Caerostris extrusa]